MEPNKFYVFFTLSFFFLFLGAYVPALQIFTQALMVSSDLSRPYVPIL